MENRRTLINFIGAISFFFIVLFIYTNILGPISFSVHNTNTNTNDVFQAQGIGSASSAPDTAVVSLGVTKEAPTVQVAQSTLNEISNTITNTLKEEGINEDSIKTTNYSINPIYSFSEETQRITGYSVSQTFEIEAPIEKVNQIIDNATKAGANNINNINFKLNDKSEENLKNQARKEAVENAKKSAKGLANASGIKLGKIINVSESTAESPIQPFAANDIIREESDSEKTNITPGLSNIEIKVILTYQVN